MTSEDWESAFGPLRQMAEAETARKREAAKAAREKAENEALEKARAAEEAARNRLAKDRAVIVAALAKGGER